MVILKGLSKARAYSTTTTIPLLINGTKVINESRYKVFSPTNEYLHDVSSITSNELTQIDQICDNSYKGFLKWSSMGQSEKYEIFQNFENELNLIKNDLIKAHSDIGIPDWFANFNFQGSLDQLKHYKSLLLTKPQGDLPVQNYSNDSRFKLSMVIKQPLGPVLSIVPWNAPGILTMRSILAPLTAGCSVVVKSSHLSPMVSYLISNAFIKSGLPIDTLQMINSKSEDSKLITDYLISNEKIKKINFTGSTKIGSVISETAGKFLKPTLMELGGKNISILLEDLQNNNDLLKDALGTSLWASWCHKGQICMCTDSIYIHESIYNDSLKILETISSDFLSNDKDLLINQRTIDHSEKINLLIEDALSKGAKIIAGKYDKKSSSSSSSFINPIVLGDIDSSMDIYHNEIFGPVVCVIKYKDIDETINNINELGFGLKCSIWTNNQFEKGFKVSEKIESGSIHLNHPTVFDDPHLPHGGTKNSGHGKFNSFWGIDEFSSSKLITFS